ncbi:MAG: substrate-binding domain-containing protein [Chthoniobacter sp.]|nr:substrate-binding domain-containing protein [Chthoniobacter sp.]
MPLRRLSIVEQTAQHLREGLRDGRWRGQLPGVIKLAAELSISTHTLRAALRMIEGEGLVALSADGRSRHVPEASKPGKRPLRIGILLYEPLANEGGQSLELYLELHHALEREGFSVFFSEKTQCGLGHDVDRIARYVQKAKADAWVVSAATRSVLEWFTAQPAPALALFGRRDGVRLAGAGLDKRQPFLQATRQLIALGHQRIVLVCRSNRRIPVPGLAERAFLDELTAHSLPSGEFNLPDWEESPDGLRALLVSLFHVTPPTALILDETPLFIAAQQFLVGRNLHVPSRVSLVCTDFDASLRWCRPPVAHIRWRSAPIIRHIVQWSNAVSQNVTDVRQAEFPAEFVAGGTIGPVWKGGGK